jgi:hypothetical protein
MDIVRKPSNSLSTCVYQFRTNVYAWHSSYMPFYAQNSFLYMTNYFCMCDVRLQQRCWSVKLRIPGWWCQTNRSTQQADWPAHDLRKARLHLLWKHNLKYVLWRPCFDSFKPQGIFMRTFQTCFRTIQNFTKVIDIELKAFRKAAVFSSGYHRNRLNIIYTF